MQKKQIFIRLLFYINKGRGWGIVYISSSKQIHDDKYIAGLYLSCISWGESNIAVKFQALTVKLVVIDY